MAAHDSDSDDVEVWNSTTPPSAGVGRLPSLKQSRSLPAITMPPDGLARSIGEWTWRTSTGPPSPMHTGARTGSGRFYSHELGCFARIPMPSPYMCQKVEHFQTTGQLRRNFSDTSLSPAKFPKLRVDVGAAADTNASNSPTAQAAPTTFPLPNEERTAKVLDEIYPTLRSVSSTSSVPLLPSERAAKLQNQDERTSPVRRPAVMVGHAQSNMLVNTNQTDVSQVKKSPTQRLLQFRQKILDKFSTMKKAFDEFGTGKELSKKDFARFLSRHFGGLSREEQDKIFDFLDCDKNGHLSMKEFHIALESVAPIKTVEDLRKRWIALGFHSMRHAFETMRTCHPTKEFDARLTCRELGIILASVGVEEPEEHDALFNAIADCHPVQPTLSIDELAAAVAAVSPIAILEDIRDRIIKKYGSLQQGFAAMDMNCKNSMDARDFIKYAIKNWRMTIYEADKAFRLIDIDRSGLINRVEFVSALRLSEPSLFLEEVRRKVRQRFRSIRSMLHVDFPGAADELYAGGEPAPKQTGGPLDVRPKVSDEAMLRKKARLQHIQESEKGKSSSMETFEGWGSAPVITRGDSAGGSVEGNKPQGGEGNLAMKKFSQFTINNADLLGKFQASQGAKESEKEGNAKTPSEFANSLAKVELTEADTMILFDLMDIDRDGKLTSFEFVRGIKLFAPSCVLEDLRLCCLKDHSNVMDAFASLPQERREQPLDVNGLREVLEELKLATGVSVPSVFDLLDHNDGSLLIGEVIASLRSAAPGSQVPLSPEMRDARARQQIRSQMAPFHRGATELRMQVREKPVEDEPPPQAARSSLGLNGAGSETEEGEDSPGEAPATGAIARRRRSRRKRPGADSPSRVSGDATPQSSPSKPKAGREGRRDSVPHAPMKQSYGRVSGYLRQIPAASSAPIIERLHGYYQHAGTSVANDDALLAVRHSRHQQFQKACHHHNILARPLLRDPPSIEGE